MKWGEVLVVLFILTFFVGMILHDHSKQFALMEARLTNLETAALMEKTNACKGTETKALDLGWHHDFQSGVLDQP